MDEDRTNWPLIVGVTAGILGAVLVATLLYSTRESEGPAAKLRDAKEIIARCHETIKEIEATLGTLRRSASP